jgi:heme/copper-type cytochrome/quinol oxidase subunit 4
LFPLQILSLLIPFLLFWKSKLSARIIQIFLILGGIEWIRILIYYARIRVENGEDWLRLAIILGVVAILTTATALVFRTESMKERYK